MKKLSVTFLLAIALKNSFSQSANSPTFSAGIQFNNTLFDPTKGNNPWGIGLGSQLFLLKTSNIKPTVEITADVYFADDKIQRETNDEPLESIENMINVLAGATYQTSQNTYVSFLAGPSFINGNSKVCVKSSFGFYFSNKKKSSAKVSYTHIFNREPITKQNSGSISFSLLAKIF